MRSWRRLLAASASLSARLRQGLPASGGQQRRQQTPAGGWCLPVEPSPASHVLPASPLWLAAVPRPTVPWPWSVARMASSAKTTLVWQARSDAARSGPMPSAATPRSSARDRRAGSLAATAARRARSAPKRGAPQQSLCTRAAPSRARTAPSPTSAHLARPPGHWQPTCQTLS